MSSYSNIKTRTKALNELGKRIKLSDRLIEHLTNPEDKVHYTQLLVEAIESYNGYCNGLLNDVNTYIKMERKGKVRSLGMYRLKLSLSEK